LHEENSAAGGDHGGRSSYSSSLKGEKRVGSKVRNIKQMTEELDLTILRCNALQDALNHANEQVTRADIKSVEQCNLIQQLENDLTRRLALLVTPSPPNHPSATFDLSVVIDPKSPSPVHQCSSKGRESAIIHTTDSSSLPLINIIAGQRDRFKHRVQELEIENEQLHRQQRAANVEIDNLRKVNQSLCRRVRYISQFVDKSIINVDEEHDMRYHSGVEDAAVNPFHGLHPKDRDNQIKNLSVPERITLATSRLLLSHRYGRYGCFVYSLIMHLLVVLTMYKLAYAAHIRHMGVS
jgi:homeobox protein cut-like